MRTCTPQELNTRMITTDDVFSPHGQLIIPKGSILTYQMISHIKYYKIDSIQVSDRPAVEEITSEEKDTFSEKVKNSKEFQEFKTKAVDTAEMYKDMLESYLNKDATLNTKELLEGCKNLCDVGCNSSFSTLDMLNNMREFDDSTYMHSLSVAVLCRLIGIWSGIEDYDLDVLTLCGMLHDIGKTTIPSEILNKPDKLTDEEFEIIKNHTKEGYRILENENIDNRIKNAALMHHERYNGTGYPFALEGKYIDDFASIVSIADVYDALTSNRIYRHGVCPFEVIAMYEAIGLREYNVKYIFTFLERISSTYIGNHVRLSDGSIGKIMMKNNQALTRPLIRLENGAYIDLREHLDLYIETLV